jgi:hypothetical protein
MIAVEILNNYKSVSEFNGAEKCKGVLFEKLSNFFCGLNKIEKF